MAKNHKKVIPFPKIEPSAWSFMAFVTDGGRDVAQDWDTDQSFEAETAFKTMIKNNRKTKNYADWPEWRHKMKDAAGDAGLVELGFKASGKAYRVMCRFNGKMCIVVICIAYHKGDQWTPKDAVKIATDRAKLVAAGKAKLIVIEDDD